MKRLSEKIVTIILTVVFVCIAAFVFISNNAFRTFGNYYADRTSGELTVIEYQERVKEIFMGINDYLDKVDLTSDSDVSHTIDLIVPLYNEVATLEAPEPLKTSDRILKECCITQVEALKEAKEIMKIGDSPTVQDIEKAQAFENTMSTIATTNSQMEQVLQDIYSEKE